MTKDKVVKTASISSFSMPNSCTTSEKLLVEYYYLHNHMLRFRDINGGEQLSFDALLNKASNTAIRMKQGFAVLENNLNIMGISSYDES